MDLDHGPIAHYRRRIGRYLPVAWRKIVAAAAMAVFPLLMAASSHRDEHDLPLNGLFTPVAPPMHYRSNTGALP